MRSNPERTAWIILSSAFATFWLIIISMIGFVYWVVFLDTEPFTTELTSVRGIVLIGNSTSPLSTSVTDGGTTDIRAGFSVSTDNTSQAILAFIGDSSLTMYGNTTIVLHETEKPHFSISSSPTQIIVEVKKGRVRATSALGRDGLVFDVVTPQTTVQLSQGSFSIEVSGTETQITTRLGQAKVIGNGIITTIEQNNRVIVNEHGQPSLPLPSAQNLLGDDNLSHNFTNSWEIYEIDFSENVTTSVQTIQFQNRTVLDLLSWGQNNIHTEAGATKKVNKDVRDFRSLRLFAEVSLVNQSLPGGGQLGSEFPIMVHIAYKDADGNDRDWFHGFYYITPPETYILYDQPDNSSERIARYLWYPYESENLLSTLGPAKPVFIKSIHLYASGWIYHSMITNISLLAEE